MQIVTGTDNLEWDYSLMVRDILLLVFLIIFVWNHSFIASITNRSTLDPPDHGFGSTGGPTVTPENVSLSPRKQKVDGI